MIFHVEPGWVQKAIAIDPGGHVGVLVEASPEVFNVCVSGRTAGLHLRDTLLVLRPGPTVSFILLFRKPTVESTLLEQLVRTGTGALNIDKCRPGVGRWPANVLVLHGPNCRKRGTRKLATPTRSRERQQSNRSRPSMGFYEPGTKRARVVKMETVFVPHFGYGDANGSETMDDWECQQDCPVPLLEEDQARYYPQFQSERDLRAWLELLTDRAAPVVQP
jgi:hypothetical protein